MADRKSRTDRLEKLTSRMERLEEAMSELQKQAGQAADAQGDEQPRLCSLPLMPERQFGPEVSVERAELLRIISKKWVNGTVLHYYLFQGRPWGGDDANQQVVRDAFDAWKDVGIGLEFREVNNPEDAEIRIGFLQGDGSWSYVGRDVLEIGQHERTMNFGWDLTRRHEEIDTAIHEIGHTLGFPHEHQNPHAGIGWDEDAVYEELGGWPNFWSRDRTYWNILRKIPPDSVEGTKWDPDSVMHYPFGPGLIREPAQYRDGLFPAHGLSQKDIEQVRRFYPPLDVAYPELRPLESQLLAVGPGEQRNFSVLPKATRKYNFGTFGQSDAVVVLFEDYNGDLRYVAGNDDGGTDSNAHLRVRLTKGRRYVLRVRVYLQYGTGSTAIMMW